MHIYFVNYNKFIGASGIHIHFLANSLVERGIKCTVCVPSDRNSVYSFGDVKYETILFTQLIYRILINKKVFLSDDPIIHAWTPRENVRLLVQWAVNRLKIPYYVHLEDNEEFIYNTIVSDDSIVMRLMKSYKYRFRMIDPQKYKAFLNNSSGVSCIIDSLEEFVPSGVQRVTFYPSCESRFFEMSDKTDLELKYKLNIPTDALIITYTGGIHHSNYEEVETLYKAIIEINDKANRNVYLLHCGLGKIAEYDNYPYILECGYIDPSHLYEFIQIADILVQPGTLNQFNNYRFPSKLPMYLASGRPVVLPKTNIGSKLHDKTNCLLLKYGTTKELVVKIGKLVNDKELRGKIGESGRNFARENLDWERSIEILLKLYE